MENSLVYIIRGLPGQFEAAVTRALAEYLESIRDPQTNFDSGFLMRQLESAAALMIPLPEYDIWDFQPDEIHEALDLLQSGDEQLWAQLLDALNDRGSREFLRLKALSPYTEDHLAFFDIQQDPARIHLELEGSLASALVNLSDVHVFPGNTCMIVIPADCLDRMRFVAGVNYPPATA